ncbi:aspartate-semialdehyde dehydrogenase [Nanoarchaeota archaeon]
MRVGVFGATGEVGGEIIEVLNNIKFPLEELICYAGKSAGKIINTPYGDKEVLKAESADYNNLDLAFWAIGAGWSKKEWEKAKESECYVVDNSSAFRYDDNIPLIVPEINGMYMVMHKSKLIANPNCTTAIAAIPLNILFKMAGLNKISISTYQSASGAGNGGRKELLEQTRNYLDGEKVENEIFAHPLPFNVIPHIDKFQENKYTKEEMKTDWETRKILGLGDYVKISSGCVRVPVERSHAEDIIVETVTPINLDEYISALEKQDMIKVSDDPLNNVYPMPISTSNNYEVEVGRIRKPIIFENGVRMFVCGDQLLRGAALNAVLIAKKLYEKGNLNS